MGIFQFKVRYGSSHRQSGRVNRPKVPACRGRTGPPTCWGPAVAVHTTSLSAGLTSAAAAAHLRSTQPVCQERGGGRGGQRRGYLPNNPSRRFLKSLFAKMQNSEGKSAIDGAKRGWIPGLRVRGAGEGRRGAMPPPGAARKLIFRTYEADGGQM